MYQLSHSTSVTENADNPDNWSVDYSRRTSISTVDYSTDSYYPSEAIDTEDEDSVVITEYFDDKDKTPVRPQPPSSRLVYLDTIFGLK